MQRWWMRFAQGPALIEAARLKHAGKAKRRKVEGGENITVSLDVAIVEPIRSRHFAGQRFWLG
jgi:hypothetical protein